MATKNIQDYHVEYMDVTRHWDPKSEPFVGADCLLTALNAGWEAHDIVYVSTHPHYGMRTVTVYHFELERGNRKATMAVIDNPYVTRLIQRAEFTIVPMEERVGS